MSYLSVWKTTDGGCCCSATPGQWLDFCGKSLIAGAVCWTAGIAVKHTCACLGAVLRGRSIHAGKSRPTGRRWDGRSAEAHTGHYAGSWLCWLCWFDRLRLGGHLRVSYLCVSKTTDWGCSAIPGPGLVFCERFSIAGAGCWTAGIAVKHH